jgi:hypothetical protein
MHISGIHARWFSDITNGESQSPPIYSSLIPESPAESGGIPVSPVSVQFQSGISLKNLVILGIPVICLQESERCAVH